MRVLTSIPAHDLNAVGDAARKVEELGYDGVSTQEIQTFLKESNFAKILLSLRDMFQKHHI